MVSIQRYQVNVTDLLELWRPQRKHRTWCATQIAGFVPELVSFVADIAGPRCKLLLTKLYIPVKADPPCLGFQD